ncbi:MAG: 3-deoxy-8-phosphooctulonate synthase [Acidobacteriota bacterium]|nr:3-deoxy-8-phosphooctulonate synthase [Acidobacteriota bacterium]
MLHQVRLGKLMLGGSEPLFIIAGPCVIESERHAMMMAEKLTAIARRLAVPFIFKASYDKANRTSVKSFRGPGIERGLKILGRIKREFAVPVLTDVHDVSHVQPAAEVCDVIQIPAFLSRQTDLLVAAGRSTAAVNIKKGQFLSPWDAKHAVQKAASEGNHRLLITERGATFGYNNLVVDFRGLKVMGGWGYPVILDVTHSLQLPGGAGNRSGGQPEFIETLARAAVAADADGIFMEVHDRPGRALSDGANAFDLRRFEGLVRNLRDLGAFVRKMNRKVSLRSKSLRTVGMRHSARS